MERMVIILYLIEWSFLKNNSSLVFANPIEPKCKMDERCHNFFFHFLDFFPPIGKMPQRQRNLSQRHLSSVFFLARMSITISAGPKSERTSLTWLIITVWRARECKSSFHFISFDTGRQLEGRFPQIDLRWWCSARSLPLCARLSPESYQDKG